METTRKKTVRPGEVAFRLCNGLFLFLYAAACLVPMLNILAKSFSSESAISTGQVWLWPKGFTLEAYEFLLTANFSRPFLIQLVVTVSGTLLSLALLFTLAYPLTRADLVGKKAILMLVIFTMVFNAGIIPNYLLIDNLGLLNNLLAVILPPAFSGFNLMIVRSYMMGIPESVVESALVEGARHTTILRRIVLPLCTPVLATMVLFVAVGYWNSYFDATIYLTKPELKTLQVFLREIVENLQNLNDNFNFDPDSAISRSPQTIRSAAVIATTLPILLVYPLLQKYYIQGISIGSVKG